MAIIGLIDTELYASTDDISGIAATTTLQSPKPRDCNCRFSTHLCAFASVHCHRGQLQSLKLRYPRHGRAYGATVIRRINLRVTPHREAQSITTCL